MSDNTNMVTPMVAAVARAQKQPYPYVRNYDLDSADLNWAPYANESFSYENGVPVRAGNGHEIVRPGCARWPLGRSSDHYKPADHVACHKRILNECNSSIEASSALMSGHGYHVVYGYKVRHMSASVIGDASKGEPTHEVETRLCVAHDHTGKGRMRASMCLYLDNRAIGAIVTTEAMHVAAQPGIWQTNIDAMIESAIVAQDAILDILTAAKSRLLTDEDKTFLESKGLKVDEGVKTALGALIAYHTGRNTKITWGVWERRMHDKGIRAILSLLPVALSRALDETLRSRALYCVPRRFARAA